MTIVGCLAPYEGIAREEGEAFAGFGEEGAGAGGGEGAAEEVAGAEVEATDHAALLAG